MRSRLFFPLVVLSGLACALCVAAAALAPAEGQSISGTVSGQKGGPIEGIVVMFLDAANAELITTATTDVAGSYDSGIVPPGSYRVRFVDTSFSYLETFLGTGDFCAGMVVDVTSDSPVSDMNQVLVPSKDVEIPLPSTFVISGVVVDATTGLGLGGIKVTALDAFNGEVVFETTTGPTRGDYSLDPKLVTHEAVRLRFSDPANRYFPQFHGAAGLDDFCLATTLYLPAKMSNVDAFLQPIPGQLAENLLDQVDSLDLPEDVATVLAAPLVKAADLLTDGNSSNDGAICGQLTAFLARVDMQERRGQISSLEAAELRESAETLIAALGCD